MNLTEHIASLDHCVEALEYTEGKTAQQAWDTCPVPEWHIYWMLQLDMSKAPAIIELLRKKWVDALMWHMPEADRNTVETMTRNPNVDMLFVVDFLKSLPDLQTTALTLKNCRDHNSTIILTELAIVARTLTDQPGGDDLIDRVRAAYPNPPWVE